MSVLWDDGGCYGTWMPGGDCDGKTCIPALGVVFIVNPCRFTIM